MAIGPGARSAPCPRAWRRPCNCLARWSIARAWLYDSPALYPDVWVALARAAERTSTIGLGPGVLVPFLRHPMTNAADMVFSDGDTEELCTVTGDTASGFSASLTVGIAV